MSRETGIRYAAHSDKGAIIPQEPDVDEIPDIPVYYGKRLVEQGLRHGRLVRKEAARLRKLLGRQWDDNQVQMFAAMNVARLQSSKPSKQPPTRTIPVVPRPDPHTLRSIGEIILQQRELHPGLALSRESLSHAATEKLGIPVTVRMIKNGADRLRRSGF